MINFIEKYQLSELKTKMSQESQKPSFVNTQGFPTEPCDSINSTPIMFDEHIVDYRDGLTKLEYFSAIALQGLLSNPNYAGSAECLAEGIIADQAVMQAEALIEKLNSYRQYKHEQLSQ